MILKNGNPVKYSPFFSEQIILPKISDEKNVSSFQKSNLKSKSEWLALDSKEKNVLLREWLGLDSKEKDVVLRFTKLLQNCKGSEFYPF